MSFEIRDVIFAKIDVLFQCKIIKYEKNHNYAIGLFTFQQYCCCR